MSHQVVKVRRETVAPCMTCPLCHKLFREATTIIECLHTCDCSSALARVFAIWVLVVNALVCRKCINKKLSNEEMECCPVCNIDLGCVPMEKLRLDHNLQDVREKIFPYKRLKVKTPEVVAPITLPAKRKERSLSSLVVSTPRISTQSGMTGRRSKSITRKASRGSVTIEKPVKKKDNSMEGQHESSSSPEMLNRSTQNTRQNSAASEPSNHPSPDKGRDHGSETWEGKVDLWKPLNCLVEAANRSKSSKLSIQGSVAKSEAPNSHDNEGIPNKSKLKENKQKSKGQDDKHCSDHTPPDSERPKKLRRVRQKKAENFGEFGLLPQVVLDAAGAKFDRKNYPIWFSLVSDGQEGNAPPLPQIAASYLRMKDGSMLVSFIKKYLKLKLNLTSEDEVEIKCMGQTVIPTLTLNNLVDLWLETTTTEKLSAKIGSSAKDFVMVLGYARRGSDS
ncbi:DREB2A-interacting protein 2 [Perilla frutescens var. hirtella]|uniref:DREB2A-interacting protein 2 n=1 Tax=Perilla frutescens var. hirtella TaxID=608512 RepID=A0AAD4IMV7_PERFH|nr:DREB2A-interacting protein 2 [Perilla frutescens var. hirtella]